MEAIQKAQEGYTVYISDLGGDQDIVIKPTKKRPKEDDDKVVGRRLTDTESMDISIQDLPDIPNEFICIPKNFIEELKHDAKYCHPVLKNRNKRYVQTDYFCSHCDAKLDYLQITCNRCNKIIEWAKVEHKAKD
jgi:hypothetical protein